MRKQPTLIRFVCVGLFFALPLFYPSVFAAPADSCWTCWGPGLPDPCRNTLYSVAVRPDSGGNDVWAVGAKGTILHWNGIAWQKVASPTSETLRSVAVARADLALAVGLNGTVLRWNGSVWSVVNAGTTNWFRAVATTPGSNGNDGWAVADKYGVGMYYRWNGSGWTNKVGGKTHLFGGEMNGLSLLSANDGWAVGSVVSGATGKLVGQIQHWNGSAWNSMTAPGSPLYAIDMVSPTNGWTSGKNGTLARWNGNEWTMCTASPTTNDLWGVDLRTGDDGWAVGSGGVILHWDGSTWTSVPSPVQFDLRSVAVVSANDAWAVGSGGVILRWNGVQWQAVVAPLVERLESLSFAPESGGGFAWAVGGGRTMLRWDGASWQPVSGPGGAYYAVSLVSRSSGWATGQGGRFYRWNGSTWIEGGRGLSAMALAMVDDSYGWALGWGTIQRWNGASWTPVSSPATSTMYDIDVVNANDIWAVGESGTILHWNGRVWERVTSPVTSWLIGISMPSVAEGRIVGNQGVFLRWNGSTWRKETVSLTEARVNGVSLLPSSSGARGWAVGTSGEVYRLSGGTWTAGCSPTANDLWDVQMVSPFDAWAVGEYGVIVHWVDSNRPPMPRHVYLPLITKP